MVMVGGEDGRGINYAVRAFQYGSYLVLFAYKVAALSHTSLVQVAHSLHTLSFLPLGL